MPCRVFFINVCVRPRGAGREFFMQLNEKNENIEIMIDLKKRETVTLKKLLHSGGVRNGMIN